MKALRFVANLAAGHIYRQMDSCEEETTALFFRWASRLIPMPKSTRSYLRTSCCRDTTYLISKAVANTPYGEPLSFVQPLVLTVSLSDHCPLGCATCYSDSRTAARPHAHLAPSDTFERISRLRTPYVIITGGEPLLDPDLSEKLDILLRSGKCLYISTNLSIAPLERLALRYPHQLAVILPIWGAPTAHDKARGKGSFQRLRNNLELATKWNCQRVVYAVISNDLGSLSIASSWGKTYPGLELKITRQIEVGRKDLARPLDLELIHQTLHSHIKDLAPYFEIISIDIPEFRTKRRNLREAIAWYLFGIARHGRCAAGNWMMHIDASGGARPCFAFETLPISSIPTRDQGLLGAWEDVKAASLHFSSTKPCRAEGLRNGRQ